MSKLKEKIESCNLNYKREISTLIILNIIILILSFVIFIFSKNIRLLLYFAIILVLFNFYYLTKYNRIIVKRKNDLTFDFINVFSYFRIYISNYRNVYMSIKEISNYASPFIKIKLIELLDNIDNDKTIKPFITFANYFNDKKIEEVMIAIYEMVNEGNNENYINQFVSIFETYKARIEKTKEEKRINTFNRICSLSIIGVGILMIIIMLGIVNMIGDLI